MKDERQLKVKQKPFSRIPLENDDPSTIAQMIEFLYRSRYNDNCDFDGDTSGDIVEQPVDIELNTTAQTINVISGP
jgi:hypothetical protein